MLDFELSWPRRYGVKDDAIREEFGMDPDIYYSLLIKLVDDPQAMAYAPTVVNRYWRFREVRSHRRRCVLAWQQATLLRSAGGE